MAERTLDVTRSPDGSFVAAFDEDRPPAPVASWADIRRLRDRHRLTDRWTAEDRAAFVALHGHPYDDWWHSLAPQVRQALAADPRGPIPSEHAQAVKRSLRHETGRDDLRVEGSFFTPEVQQYIAEVSRSGADGA